MKKIIGIFIVTLLIATGFSQVFGSAIIEKNTNGNDEFLIVENCGCIDNSDTPCIIEVDSITKINGNVVSYDNLNEYNIYEGTHFQFKYWCNCTPYPCSVCIWIDPYSTIPDNIYFNPEPPVSGTSSVSCTLEWTPSYCQAGYYDIIFCCGLECYDPEHLESHCQINVLDYNRNPTIEVDPEGLITVYAGDTVSIGAVGSDPDVSECGWMDDPCTLTCSDSEHFFAEQLVGNYEWHTTSGDVGIYDINFRINDNKSGSDEKSVTVEVKEKDDEDEFEDQPDSKHSNINCHPTPEDDKDAESIVDFKFAKALHDVLGDNGFHSMVITFGQCYGGGMIDDISDKFSKSTKPISMNSAAKHNEPSKSGPHGPTDKDTGYNYWTEAYKNVHPGKTGNTNNNPTESEAYSNAKNDPAWKKTSTPQHKTLNNGGNIKLGDGTGGSGATSYHAILFAGSTNNRDDYWNDIARQHKMLTNSGYPAANIKTLFGDGNVPPKASEPAGGIDPDPATRENLVKAISNLKKVMNKNEQLYIFITDHGSPEQGTDTSPASKLVPPKSIKDSSNTFEFSPMLDYLKDALQSPFNTYGPSIKMNIKTQGTITSNWKVFFNDEPVNNGDNTFPENGDEANLSFPIDPDTIDLNGMNDVWLMNSQTTDDSIEVEIYFSIGDIEPHRPLPPEVPTIEGKENGKTGMEYEYNFVTTDPNGDDVSFYVKWGDGTVTTWTSFQSSGSAYSEGHIWNFQGKYNVEAKAKDVYGDESDWTELQVSMPKTKEYNNPFLRFLENHPNLFPLLRQILGL